MRAEIIAVGTELLLGQIVNTNAQFLSQHLADAGVDVFFQTVVGDNAFRLAEAIRIAESRADLILLTGGLGPTQDDLTKETLAAHLGRALVMDEQAMERISAFFQTRNVPMVDSNRKQAIVIEGSQSLQNDTGLAVGVALTCGGKHYMLLPGPPKELQPMFRQYGLPWIQTHLPSREPLYSKVLRFYGIGESTLEHELIDLIEGQTDPTIAPLAKEGEVTLRLTTKAPSPEEGEEKIKATEAEIRRRVGKYLYGLNDDSLEKVVVSGLKAMGKTVGAAESCTGGLFSQTVSSVSGASSVFPGGFITYSLETKRDLLGIEESLLKQEGTVSEQTALAMAEYSRERLETDYAVSITGVAGPEPLEGKPAGTVYISIAELGKKAEVFSYRWSGNRESIRNRAVKQALYLLWQHL